jgi:hypothetical protein
LVGLCALLSEGAFSAQGQQMPKVKAGVESKLMQMFVGTWKVTELWEAWEGMTPGGEGAGQQIVTMGPGDLSVRFTYASRSGPFKEYRAQGLMSWEPGQPEPFRAAWVQSVTPGVSIENGHLEGSDLVMSYEIVERGTPYTVRNLYSDITRSSYTVTSYYVERSGRTRKALTLKYIRE